MISIVIVLFCALIGAVAQLLLKLSSKSFSFNPRTWLNKWLIIGAFLHLLSALLFIYALKQSSLSLLYPLFATSYIWLSLLAAPFLREPMSKLKWIGILIIILGVIFIVK